MFAKKLVQDETPSIALDHERTTGISINKYLADCGIASRRASEVIIKSNRVTIDGVVAKLGDRVYEGQKVCVDNVQISPITDKKYYLLNKPIGIICTVEPVIDNIRTYMNLDEQLFPVGRLDKDSSGIIIMTNDGDIVNKILRSEFGHEKEYVVQVDKPFDKAFIDYMQNGVMIYNLKKNTYQMTEKTIVKVLSDDTFSIILKQGLNRQIRRMTQALGYQVIGLKRIRIMHLNDDGLPIGYYRHLTLDELTQLKEHLIDRTKR